MTINFLPILTDSQTISIYDASDSNQLPIDMYRMTLQIKSSVMPTGKLDTPVDMLAYIRSARKAEEIYEIKSDLLGVGESLDIPDGIYTLEYTINDIYKKEHSIVIYQRILNEVNTLLTAINYSIKIGTYDVTYVGDYSDSDIEKIRLAKALMDEIEFNSTVKSITSITDALEKLRRLLLLINI